MTNPFSCILERVLIANDGSDSRGCRRRKPNGSGEAAGLADCVDFGAMRKVDALYWSVDRGVVTLISVDRGLNAAATAEGLAVDEPLLHESRIFWN